MEERRTGRTLVKVKGTKKLEGGREGRGRKGLASEGYLMPLNVGVLWADPQPSPPHTPLHHHHHQSPRATQQVLFHTCEVREGIQRQGNVCTKINSTHKQEINRVEWPTWRSLDGAAIQREDTGKGRWWWMDDKEIGLHGQEEWVEGKPYI